MTKDISKPKKIVFIAGTLGNGGAERQLLYILQLLKLKNFEILVICLSTELFYSKKIKDLNIDIKVFNHHNNPIFKFFFIVKHCYKYNPSIIQSVHNYVNFYSMLAAKTLNKRFFAAIRNEVVYLKNKSITFFTLNNAELIVCNNMRSVNGLKKIDSIKNKLFYLANGLDTSMFKPNINENSKKLKILYLGGLRKVKRIDKFLDICNYLSIKNIDFNAKIVGSGPLRNDLIRYAKKLSLDCDLVEFIDQQESIANYFNWSDILIQTSETEGMSNVILEAMSSGLLVFSTYVGDVKSLIKNGINGFIFSSHDSSKICTEFVDIIKNKENNFLSIKKKAYLAVNQKHSLKALDLRLNELYKCK